MKKETLRNYLISLGGGALLGASLIVLNYKEVGLIVASTYFLTTFYGGELYRELKEIKKKLK